LLLLVLLLVMRQLLELQLVRFSALSAEKVKLGQLSACKAFTQQAKAARETFTIKNISPGLRTLPPPASG
jgi:hypothetical protein